VLSDQRFAYFEEDVIDVTGGKIVARLCNVLPGPRSSLLYISQTWLVEGHWSASRSAFLFWEEAWMPPGGRSTSPGIRCTTPSTSPGTRGRTYGLTAHVKWGISFRQNDFHVGVTADSSGVVTRPKPWTL